jgi:signal transduction histidine kinase
MVVASGEGGGHGVIGMRERAALFGGTLTAEPRRDRGFEVRATLPYTDAV